jgi:ATP-dependent protease HslVU (ClpYQ) peptidase subunit
MTVIVWDGTTLAADRQCTVSSNFKTTLTKIFRLTEGLIGFAGNCEQVPVLLQWFLDGCIPDLYPEYQADKDTATECIVVLPDGKILLYDANHLPIYIEAPCFAIGSGAQFAMGAMRQGATAEEAVKIAIHYDVFCGNGITSLTFDDKYQEIKIPQYPSIVVAEEP